jgi:hypothetical protein
MAALLATGPEATLSHTSAAAHWGLLLIAAVTARVHVTAPRSRPQKGIRVYRNTLEPDETTTRNGIAVTTAARTILDLAATTVTHAQLERALREAEVLRLTTPDAVEALLDRHPGRRGATKLRQVLAVTQSGRGISRSRLEDRFLSFLLNAGLPLPERNTLIEAGGRTFEVDCLWPAQRLIVELDGGEAHHTRAAFESDRARDRTLQAAGWTVVRVTWRQLTQERRALASDLGALLRRAG